MRISLVLILATVIASPTFGEDLRPEQLQGCWHWPRPYPPKGSINWCFKDGGIIHGSDFDGSSGIGIELTWRMGKPGTLIIDDDECVVRLRREDGIDHLVISGCPFAMEMKPQRR